MRRLAFAVPGDLATPTGGYAYDRRIISELRAADWRVEVIELGEGFPFPSPASAAQASRLLESISGEFPTIVDGLALGVLPGAARAMKSPLVAMVHHPLALETGLSASQMASLQASETSALAAARAVIVSSPATARTLVSDYGVPPGKVVVALPGSDRRKIVPRDLRGPLRLLAVGAISPRKGYDDLIEALAPLADQPWLLTIVGALDRNLDCVQQLQTHIAALGWNGRVDLAGSVSEERLHEYYQNAHVFVLASRFEGYGMAYTEAIAHGLPVIGTTGGAIPETVPASASILVEPGDIAALTEAIRQVITDPPTRQRLADQAVAAADDLPTWNDAAVRIAKLIEGLS